MYFFWFFNKTYMFTMFSVLFYYIIRWWSTEIWCHYCFSCITFGEPMIATWIVVFLLFVAFYFPICLRGTSHLHNSYTCSFDLCNLADLAPRWASHLHNFYTCCFDLCNFAGLTPLRTNHLHNSYTCSFNLCNLASLTPRRASHLHN